jgi:hypothetical protein
MVKFIWSVASILGLILLISVLRNCAPGLLRSASNLVGVRGTELPVRSVGFSREVGTPAGQSEPLFRPGETTPTPPETDFANSGDSGSVVNGGW